jgi:hypothetical protein
MYSDSPSVVDALAALVESIVVTEKPVSEDQMTQARYIIQVDKSLFQSRFTPEQLQTIETKEMAGIVEDLLSAVGLQRFRFTERQNKGTFRYLVLLQSLCLLGLTDSLQETMTSAAISLVLVPLWHRHLSAWLAIRLLKS